ncbi:MAG: hypothetical protein ACUVX8_01920 [Candidatus Zipacnadales bacterium]
MATEQAAQPIPKRRSSLPKLLLVALLLLALAVVVNLKDIRAIAAGEKTFKSVLYGKVPAGQLMEQSFKFPEPSGPENAKVKIWVLAQEGNSCHEPLIPIWMAVGDLEPKRVRVEFYNTHAAPLREDGTRVEVGCDAGVVINGENKFEVGKGEQKRTIYLTGPTPAVMGDQFPPEGAPNPSPPDSGPQGWTYEDVVSIVNAEIAKAYGKPGTLTVGALKAMITTAAKRLPRPDQKGAEQPPNGSSGASSS